MRVMLSSGAWRIQGSSSDILWNEMESAELMRNSEDEMRSQMEVNFYGPLRVIRAFLPRMRAKKSGSIVLISSGAG